MNIVFLDIDGVLNTPNYAVQAHQIWKKTNGWFKSKDEFGALFDPLAVDCLVYLCDVAKAKVVISSTWRKDGLQRMKDLFKMRGIDIDVLDVTPILGLPRGEEIEVWLSMNDDVTNYVILDDHFDFTNEQIRHHFVECSGKYGFSHHGLSRALQILLEKV